MKTKFKYVTLMAAALLVGFTSCSNDEEKGGTDNSAPKNMLLKITQSAPSTYGEGGSQAAGQITFSTGDLYFTDAAGVIKKHYTISSTPTSATNINMTALTGATGETITNLSGDVKSVYVVGNTPSTVTLPTSGNISAVKAVALAVQTQATVSNVSLYGVGTLPATPTTPGTPGVSNDLYAVSLTLNPTVARIELTDIKATGTAITGFEVAGIFVDKYYSQADVSGAVVAGNMKDNTGIVGATAIAAAFKDASPQYPATLKPSIYDWYSPALASVSNEAKPSTAGNVWGYNVFATTAGSAVPRILIRLTNITTTTASGITFTDDQFIVIKGFKDAGTPLATIEAGKVYKIAASGLQFDETILTPDPNAAAIDVEVKVSVASWVPVAVTPQL